MTTLHHDERVRRYANVVKVVLQRELNCGFVEAQRLAWVVADALAERAS